nr:hypothetical protein CFP56_11224 [Quercus suber]
MTGLVASDRVTRNDCYNVVIYKVVSTSAVEWSLSRDDAANKPVSQGNDARLCQNYRTLTYVCFAPCLGHPCKRNHNLIETQTGIPANETKM